MPHHGAGSLPGSPIRRKDSMTKDGDEDLLSPFSQRVVLELCGQDGLDDLGLDGGNDPSPREVEFERLASIAPVPDARRLVHAAFLATPDHLPDDVHAVQFPHDALVRVEVDILAAVVPNQTASSGSRGHLIVESVKGIDRDKGQYDDGYGDVRC